MSNPDTFIGWNKPQIQCAKYIKVDCHLDIPTVTFYGNYRHLNMFIGLYTLLKTKQINIYREVFIIIIIYIRFMH